MTTSDPHGVVRIGKYIVNLEDGLVLRDDEELSLHTRTAAVLRLLVQAEGGLVSGNEILSSVWPSNQVGTNALYKAINELREAFEDDHHNPSYIENLPRKGYRLIARVTGVDSGKRRTRVFAAALSAAVLLAASALVAYWNHQPDAVAPSIAVLPFTNVDGHSESDYLAFGIAEALLDGLARVPGIQVAARTDSLNIDPARLSSRAIGSALGVNHLLEGSVQRSGNRIRVTVQLIQLPDGMHVYSDRFDEDATGLLEIQDSIASHVVDVLHVALDPEHRRRMIDWGTSNPAAYHAYLQGEYLYHQETETDNWSRALALYEEAIRHDPDFSAAYAMVIGVLGSLSVQVDTPSLDRLRSHAAAIYTTALENDIDAEIMSEMSLIMRMLTGVGLTSVERQCREQISSGEATETTYTIYGRLLMGARLFREGIAYIDIAKRLVDDDHKFIYEQIKNPGRKGLGHLDEAIAVLKRARLTNPNNIPNLGGLILMHLQVKDARQARFYLDELERSDTNGVWHHGLSMIVGAATGELTPENMTNGLRLRQGIDFNYGNGAAYLILGDVERGLVYWDQLSNQAIEALYYWLPGIEVLFPDSVVSDARYQNFLNELGIGVAWHEHLMSAVAELAPITGIELSEETMADLEVRQIELGLLQAGSGATIARATPGRVEGDSR